MKTIAEAGQVALAHGLDLWRQLIIEPRVKGEHADSAAAIDRMIRTADGLDWTWYPPFDEGSDYEWCGAFAATCWAAAGLDLDIRRLYWSSTSRLAAYAKYQPHFGSENEARVMARFPRPKLGARISIELNERSTPADITITPQAGDVLLVGAPGSRMGTHVTLVESYEVIAGRGVFHTVEGNARGSWPDSRQRPHTQGVIRQERPLGLARGQSGYHARRLIRPSVYDLTGGAG